MNCANLQEVLLEYRKHDNNASNHKKEMVLETEIIQKRLIEFLTSNKNEQEKLLKNFTVPDVNFIQKIFSVVNVNNLKIIRILGFKIKFKRFR